MRTLDNAVDEIPPIKQPMRFGNKAFRSWHARLVLETNIFLDDLLSDQAAAAESAQEIAPYILEMFGNTTRIDYGTGHELNFVILFLIFHKLGIVAKKDFQSVILVAFFSYLKTMRKLQTVYMLEPAG